VYLGFITGLYRPTVHLTFMSPCIVIQLWK